MKLVKDIDNNQNSKKISDKEAEEAFKTILAWMGEDPSREGLLETPKRVVKAFKEYFKGYKEDPIQVLDKTFGDVDGYDDMVIQKNISVQSHCEHHMAPIIGKAHVAYISNGTVVGLSKMNRIVQYYAQRPQVQERLTLQIVEEMQNVLKTKDVACVIDAKHICINSRGVCDPNSSTITSEFGGAFKNEARKNEFLDYIKIETEF